MPYVVTISRTTGGNLEEQHFEQLTAATDAFQRLIKTTPYERVLIVLLEKRAPQEENTLDVYFKDGISYNIPKVGDLVKAGELADRTPSGGIPAKSALTGGGEVAGLAS